MKLALECMTKRYATFSGRAQRREFWLFVLIYLILLLIAYGVDIAIGTYDEENGIGVVGGILILALLIPNLAVSVRRLHDTDRSGWWILIALIPLIGPIWFLVLAILNGTDVENRFGANPIASEQSG
jgi:uncharacterized membrane protein YhaH (DUF805 family)